MRTLARQPSDPSLARTQIDPGDDLSRKRARPEVYLVDLHLRLMATCDGPSSGPEFATTVAAYRDEIEPRLRERLRAGDEDADGTVVAPLGAETFFRAIRMTGRFNGYCIVLERRRAASAHRDLTLSFGLSQRECEVLELIIAGRRNADIATELDISDSTVQTHVRNIGLKMECSKRSAMISKALLS